jgi:polysaccharide export outer membrane protein
MSIIFVVMMTAALSLQSAQPVPAQHPPSGIAAAPDYVVGPQDVLGVTVTASANIVQDLSKEVTVDQDGTFDYPMLGRVQAGGKGVRQIEADMRAMLMKKGLFSVEPTVSVDVKAYRSQSVWVMGAVRAPGAQTIAGNASVMSVLSQAGFTTDSGSYIMITHRPKNSTAAGPVSQNDPNAEKIRISLKDLESGAAQNIPLRDGDTIFVASAEHYLITGYVHAPGQYVLEDELTVLQALARAGGATDQAAQNRITITRMVNGKMEKIRAKLSDGVQAGDTIDVPRRYM